MHLNKTHKTTDSVSRQNKTLFFQPKLTINQPNDVYEQEADTIADKVMRMPDSSANNNLFFKPSVSSVQRKCAHCEEGQKNQLQRKENSSDSNMSSRQTEDYINSLSDGRSLNKKERSFFEPRMGYDFSDVKIHTGADAIQLNRELSANAFTVGNDIYFNEGQYKPDTRGGGHLLAHELTHTIQQKNSNNTIQRDVSAYNKEKEEIMPDYSGEGTSSTFIKSSAEASGLRIALSDLLKQDKIKEVVSVSGNKSWFSANQHKNAQLADIEAALVTAGYANAKKIAKAIYDIHSEYLYTNQEVILVTMFGSQTISSKKGTFRQTSRSMTEYEIRQAKRVFKSAIDYPKVTIEENSNIIAIGGYARTVGNTINFPDDSYRSMTLMMHELTHVWQYQTTGWTYAPKALWAQITEGYSYTSAGKTTDQGLIDDRKAGKTLYSYNKEQQGDILSDYFRRLQSGTDISAYQPFIDDIK